MRTDFFNSALQSAQYRVAPSRNSSTVVLDKNEQSQDVERALKAKVLERLLHADWNRYPTADYRDIETKIAEYCRLSPENITLSAGSANSIVTLLNYFALNSKHIVIAQPTYSLFDYHCKTYSIPYTPWYLNERLEYDLGTLPTLGNNSVLIITSPNNPVGNCLTTEQLESILIANPESCVILDGVYCEFSSTDFTPLIKKYENLIVLRSFSKAFPIAGLRLGYVCAAPKIAATIKKLFLQFSITDFSLIFAREMLFSPEFMECSRKNVEDIISQRNTLAQSIKSRFKEDMVKVFPSEGNFLLVRVFNDNTFKRLMEDFADQGIKVLNTSSFAQLHNTFRVSVSTAEENHIFLTCMSNSLKINQLSSHIITKAVA